MQEYRIQKLPFSFDPYKDKLPFTVLYDGGCLGQLSLYLLSLIAISIFISFFEGGIKSNLDLICGLILCSPVLIFFIIEAYLYIRAWIKWHRLLRNGIMLPGYLIKATTLDKKEQGQWDALPSHKVNLEMLYSFQSPSGKQINGRLTKYITRLSLPRHLPQPGTPITVFYAGDKCHIML